MSDPTEMPCIHPSDECPSPLRCNASGACIESLKDGAKSYDLGLAESRQRGIKDPFKRREE